METDRYEVLFTSSFLPRRIYTFSEIQDLFSAQMRFCVESLIIVYDVNKNLIIFKKQENLESDQKKGSTGKRIYFS